jgi:hypothetical protein
MRAVDPIAYIRATGLRPEDSYGFLPVELGDASDFFFLYRDRPEYEEGRVKLPSAGAVSPFGDPFGVGDPFGGGSSRTAEYTQPVGPMNDKISDVIAQAQQMQQQWAGQGIAGGPDESEASRIERIDKLKEMGAINEQEHKEMVSQVKGGSAGPEPGTAPAAKAATDAPQIVLHRVYPGLRMRSSTRQLNHFMPDYRDALGLCSEDVYGVFPRETRTSPGGEQGASTIEWDDFWIVYRDRDEYAQGRETWAKEMNKKGDWPEAEVFPGVAEPGKASFDKAKVTVEKDRWPRAKMVMKKQGSDLGDALREKIGKWGYEPEDSLGFCPDFDNSGIYFAWRKP